MSRSLPYVAHRAAAFRAYASPALNGFRSLQRYRSPLPALAKKALRAAAPSMQFSAVAAVIAAPRNLFCGVHPNARGCPRPAKGRYPFFL